MIDSKKTTPVKDIWNRKIEIFDEDAYTRNLALKSVLPYILIGFGIAVGISIFFPVFD